MAKYTLDKYRNIGIMAHIDAGKTTTTEECFIIPEKVIKLEKFMFRQLQWIGWSKNKEVLLLHRLPQHVFGEIMNKYHRYGSRRFYNKLERSLKVLDGAVAVFDGVAGVDHNQRLFGDKLISTKFKNMLCKQVGQNRGGFL